MRAKGLYLDPAACICKNGEHLANSTFRFKCNIGCESTCFETRKKNIKKIFENIKKSLPTKAKFNIIGSKSNFSLAQVKEILDAHENTLMKLFNTAAEKLERKVDNLTTKSTVFKKEMVDLKSSMQFHSDTIDKKFLEVEIKVSQVYVVNDENTKT